MPFGVELLQLIPHHQRIQQYKAGSHQCLSAWSFFSCDDNVCEAILSSLQVTSAFRRGASSAGHLGIGNRQNVKTMSPVPFGVELLQLKDFNTERDEIIRNVTSAFRRGASSAVMFLSTSPSLWSMSHQCLSAWSFFSCRESRQ